ncbi:hypothetical protein RA28_14020 [Ruegeria sp. ANG-S4]|nr:hypothetical protein RA28_14020 [Ruegeria sp. ANG-S4]
MQATLWAASGGVNRQLGLFCDWKVDFCDILLRGGSCAGNFQESRPAEIGRIGDYPVKMRQVDV